MFFRLVADFPGPVEVPCGFDLGASVYRALAASLPVEEFVSLHSGGRYRPFCFSSLQGKRSRKASSFLVEDPWLLFSSVKESLVSAFAEGLLKAGLAVGEKLLKPISVAGLPDPFFGFDPSARVSVTLRLLSPITVSKLLSGKKRCVLYASSPAEFALAVAKNAALKHAYFFGESYPPESVFFAFSPRRSPASVSVPLHGGKILGTLAPAVLSGPLPVVRTAVLAGLGERTAQGFGCAEVAAAVALPARAECLCC